MANKFRAISSISILALGIIVFSNTMYKLNQKSSQEGASEVSVVDSQLLKADFSGLSIAKNKSRGAKIPDEYIIKFKDGVDKKVFKKRNSIKSKHDFNKALNGMSAKLSKKMLEKLKNNPDIESITPNRVVSISARGGKKTRGGTTSGQVVPSGISRIGAEPGSLNYDGSGVGVAVVDTGIDLSYTSDLSVSSECFTAFSSCNDDQGHGTHVAGIIAAKDNDTSVVGVAPNSTLYAVKVLGQDGSGSDAGILAGLDWIAQKANSVSPPIKVVNLSLGRPGTIDDNPSMRAAFQTLQSMGIAVVVAAGNDSSVEVSQTVPATYPEVIAVASTTAKDGRNQKCRSYSGIISKDTASFFTTDGAFNSSTGIGITTSAPGEQQEDISRRCQITSSGILSTKMGGGTVRLQGTSMAAPHVAGVAALVAQKNPLALSSLKSVIRSTNQYRNSVPNSSPTSGYTFDGEREGVISAASVLNSISSR